MVKEVYHLLRDGKTQTQASDLDSFNIENG